MAGYLLAPRPHRHVEGPHKVGRSNAHDALVERCLHGGAVSVEEPEADVADCAGVPELVLFGFGERVTALAQQG